MFHYLLTPWPALFFLVSAGFLLGKRDKKKLARWCYGLAVAFFLLVSTPFLPRWAIYQLERQYPVFDCSMLTDRDRPVHIMVLGAGSGYEERFPPTNQINSTTLARLAEGYRIYKELPNARLVLSAASFGAPFPQARLTADAAVALGASPADTLLLATATNTSQEAASYARRFGDSGAQLVVATDARHMPRALYLFRQNGLQPLPAPTNHLIRKSWRFNFISYLPSTQSISLTEKAVHEYLGLLYARFIE